MSWYTSTEHIFRYGKCSMPFIMSEYESWDMKMYHILHAIGSLLDHKLEEETTPLLERMSSVV